MPAVAVPPDVTATRSPTALSWRGALDIIVTTIAGVAQLAERQLPKLKVVGSRPITRSNAKVIACP